MTPLKLRIVVPARTDRRIASLLGAIEHEARLIGADVAAVPDVPPDDEGDEVYLLVPEELFPRTALTVPAYHADKIIEQLRKNNVHAEVRDQ